MGTPIARWRAATPADDDAIVAMCLELDREDPGPVPIGPESMRRTLDALRREPTRGRAVVLAAADGPIGYALLVSFWSNELGGDVCEIDELFVRAAHRSGGLGSSLVEALARGDLWPVRPVALTLAVRPDNARARALYERLGFHAHATTMVKRL
jgi:ribosomal protein S18 acetylase RimI-like enzyme